MIKELVSKIQKANDAYRIGKPIISDKQYDIIVEELQELDPHNDILTKVGHVIEDSRKTKLPIDMASLSKVKSIDEIYDWIRNKGIPENEDVVITPKFDGLSLCVEESKGFAVTRGDGEYGQKSNEHYKYIGNHLEVRGLIDTLKYTFGEVMMSKNTFISKYSNDFANPRNLVAGLLNSKTVDYSLISSLRDCNYIKYGAQYPDGYIGPKLKTKEELLNLLNLGQTTKVRFHVCKVSELTEELLINLFHTLSPDYEIDGVVIEINKFSLQEKLGRETSSNNPAYSVAFKHESFTETAETEIIGLTWGISKNGLLKPVAQVNPIHLDGVTVSNVTCNNARFVKDMGIGVGSIVKIVRSGMVIPKIIDVVKSVKFEMPTIEGIEIGWNDNEVELITLTETDDQKIKKIISFFKILECDNVGEGVITQIWNAGYKTIKDILELTPNELSKLEGFGKRKSVIVYNSIQSKIKDVKLSKLQHASNLFENLGSRKLVLLEHFTEKPTLDQVMSIEGFAEISAKSYLESYDRFFDFIKDLPITIKKEINVLDEETSSSDLKSMVVVFTGVRRPDLSDIIISRGGKESSGLSKNTTHLICKDKTSTSSKMQKAIDLGVTILSVEELEELLS